MHLESPFQYPDGGGRASLALSRRIEAREAARLKLLNRRQEVAMPISSAP